MVSLFFVARGLNSNQTSGFVGDVGSSFWCFQSKEMKEVNFVWWWEERQYRKARDVLNQTSLLKDV